MNTYAVKQYFEQYPKLTTAFETYDGVLHPTRKVAEKWVERHANRKIVEHINPAFEVKVPEGPKMIKRIVTEEDLEQNPKLIEANIQVGDEIEVPEGPLS